MNADVVEFNKGYDAGAWQDSLVKKGHEAAIIGDERNVLQALRTAPALRGLVRFDEFALHVELTRSPPWRECRTGERWADDDDTALMSYLQSHGIAVRGKNVVTDCVSLVAKDARFHPVRAYLDALEWDRAKRLDAWLQTYFGAAGNTDYLAAAGRCWLISAVARVSSPGCQADHALVLEAPQGRGKSSAARILAVDRAWFADSVGDVGTKDSALQLSGRWLIELSELASIRRAELETMKGYITRTQDVFRPPYGRRAITVPRQSVFIGTTNENAYLRDRSGNRRFWPVACTCIDLESLYRDRDQLWAEANALYRAGERWHLDADHAALAAAEQDERLQRSEIDVLVADYLDAVAAAGQTEITSTAVFAGALHLDPHATTYAETAAKLGTYVAAAIEASGWTRVRRVGRAKQTLYRRHVDRGSQGSLIHSRARAHIEDYEKSLSNPVHLSRDCPDCHGSGYVNGSPCDMCGTDRGADGSEL